MIYITSAGLALSPRPAHRPRDSYNMSMPKGGGGGDGQQQDEGRRRSVGLDGAEDASNKATAEASRRNSGSRRPTAEENAYPWLNAGAVGRPRSAGPVQQQKARAQRARAQRSRASDGNRQSQWQKSATSHGPVADRQGSAPPASGRGRSLGGTTDHGEAAVPRSSSQDMLSNAALALTTPTKAAAAAAAASTLPASGFTQSQSQRSTPKHTKSWRRPMGVGGGRGRGGRRGGSSRSDGDDDDVDEGGVISFRDATLVAWLNSVLVFERLEEQRGADGLEKDSR